MLRCFAALSMTVALAAIDFDGDAANPVADFAKMSRT